MLIREDVVRRLENDRLAAVMLACAGAEGITVPDVEDELERFERSLNEPLKIVAPVDTSRIALREALGLSAVPERNSA